MPDAEPTPKDTFLSLMTFEDTETRVVSNVRKEYMKYRCPRPDRSVKFIVFPKNSGFYNLCSHLKSYYGHGYKAEDQIKRAKELFLKATRDMRNTGGTILLNFAVNSLSTYDKAVYRWLRLMVLRNTALSHVRDHEVRQWVCMKVSISEQTVVKSICEMLAEIDTIAKSLQSYDRTFGDCADDIDLLIETIQEDKDHQESPMYQCKFE